MQICTCCMGLGVSSYSLRQRNSEECEQCPTSFIGCLNFSIFKFLICWSNHVSEGEKLACKGALHYLLQRTTEAEGQGEVDYRKGNYPLKSEYTSTRPSMHLRAHLQQYMLTLHTYLLHISFHKEFLIKMGSCFLWNLVLHHTLLKLLGKKKKKREQGCYSSNSNKHLLDSNRALCKPWINDVTVLHYFVFTHHIYLHQPLTLPAL